MQEFALKHKRGRFLFFYANLYDFSKSNKKQKISAIPQKTQQKKKYFASF